MPELTIGAAAELVGGEVHGDPERVIRGLATLENAAPDQLSFVAQPRYLPYVQATRAGAIVVPLALAGEVPEDRTQIRVEDAHKALYRLLPAFHPPPPRPDPGVHPTAVVDGSAELGRDVCVGPYAVVGAEAKVGDGTVVGSHVVIGPGSRIGAECTLHPHATLYPGVEVGDRCVVHSGARLGREGFGYVWLEGGHRHVPQVGRCVIGNDVDIGTNVTIDRGSIGDTVVGDGTKIDSLVHIGHNVKVGKHVILVAQVGIAGSTDVGDGAVLGGQVGVAGHLSIGAGARAGAQAGIIGDVAPGETVSGYPARPHREALRAQASLFRLPEWIRRIQKLERAVFGGGRKAGEGDQSA